MEVYGSKREARRRAVETPSDSAALIASAWPPYGREEIGLVARTLCRAATIPGAIGPRHFMSRLMQLGALLRKRGSRYATSKTWSAVAPGGRTIRFPAADPGAVAFKEMAAKHGGADYERALIEFIVPRLQPGDVFVDVGAHVGSVSAFAPTTGAPGFPIALQRARKS